MFSEIEKTVSQLGYDLLPLVEHKLLAQISMTFVGKKIRNKNAVRIDGSHTSFWEEVIQLDKGRCSQGLDALLCFLANEVSYDKLGMLLEVVVR